MRAAGDTESKLMREQRGFKKEGVRIVWTGGSVLGRCWWAQMGRRAQQWPRTQVVVPVSRLAFHVARLLIANFNRNNNKNCVMEPESFRARKDVIKKLKFRLPAACKHGLAACKQHFSRKTCPFLQGGVKVGKAKPTKTNPQAGCNWRKKERKKKSPIKCKHKNTTFSRTVMYWEWGVLQ